MSPEATSKQVLVQCPSCGAAVGPAERTCWLCQWDLRREIVTAEVVAEPRARAGSSNVRTALIFGLGTLGLMTIGSFFIAPGIGILLGIVFIVAVFGTVGALKGLPVNAAASGEHATVVQAYASPTAVGGAAGGSHVGLLILKALGIIALIGLSAIIAFGVFCAICIAVVANS